MLSILFVDEDSSLRLLFGDALRNAGHRVETAPDAEATSSLLRRERFDLVITELRAPRIDGLSLLRKMHRDHPGTEVLLTTFRPGVPEAALALADGAADYLIKPFDVDEAVLRVHRLFKERHARARCEDVQPEETWVLLVCQDDTTHRNVSALLERSAVATSVDRIKSFSEAHARLRRRGRNLVGDQRPIGPRHDAIICVLPLAGISDLDAVLELQSLAPELPLVVIGPGGDETLAMRTVQVGAQEFLPAEELDTRHLGRAVRFAIERKSAEQRMVYLAHHDHLTGLANRLLFRERLSHARARSRRDKRKLAMMFLDLDRFKQINDSLGHEAGDSLLREVAKRLRHAVRDQDTVARLGGDEFAVLLEDVADKREAAQIAQRVLETVKEPITIDSDQLMITTSIGIAVSPDVWDTTGDLVSCADEAMYLAKERGRDNFYMFGDDHARSKAEHDLRLALERDEFVLHYQPLLSLAKRSVVGSEALLRWQRPGGNVIPPADFIPFLEESGLIVPVGARVLEMACAQARWWSDAGAGANRISVNLSAVQLDRDDLPSMVMRSLEKAGLSPDRLQLEITESVLMRDTSRAQAMLTSLKKRGVRIAIDDFGTGYSSLAYIHRFPIDTVKIDRTFVRQIPHGGSGAAIVGAIIGLAHKLNMEVVAEGVETEEELSFLRDEGCDLIQGFLSGRPQPAEVAAPLARRASP